MPRRSGQNGGVVVYIRHWQRDQLGGMFAFHLVRRDDDGIVLWAPAGTRGWLFDIVEGGDRHEALLFAVLI